MTCIYMIRHGKAAAGWDGDADPGLNELGQTQAEAVAAKIQSLLAKPCRFFQPLPALPANRRTAGKAWSDAAN